MYDNLAFAYNSCFKLHFWISFFIFKNFLFLLKKIPHSLNVVSPKYHFLQNFHSCSFQCQNHLRVSHLMMPLTCHMLTVHVLQVSRKIVGDYIITSIYWVLLFGELRN